ncbi:MAPEG family protein [uncultured Bradyrhizobium sp.]|uniref:MAPEG family protein n=1 Tax=uncultured Bradyrhizobium sp. TaxID=199684 RepID=UPI0026359496|nr:MAPEG family protein [uncultured Bradyrhizobium sp.]
MTTELATLAAGIVFGIAHIIVTAHLQSWQRGYHWTASSREQSVPPLTGLAGRAERSLRNYLETFSFFAAAIVLAAMVGAHNWLTLSGAQLYLWGRIAYTILYAADLSLARSMIWNVPTIGILMIVVGSLLK